VSQLDRRQVLKMFAASAAAGVTGGVAGCATTPLGTQMEQPSGRTITLGLLSPALGPYSKVGDDITKGFKLYLEDHGKLLGRHYVDLKTAEEGATPESAVAAMKSLLAKSPLAVAGVASPTSLAAVASSIEGAKVPLVSCGISPATLTTALFIWRVSHVEGEAGRAAAPFARGEGGRAYVIYEESATAAEEARQFMEAYRDVGGQIAGESRGKGGHSLRLQQAANQGADVIFAAVSGNDAGNLLEAYRVADLRQKLVGPGSLTETVDLTKMTRLPQEVYTAMYYAPDLDNEVNRRFVSSFHKQHGVPPSTFAMAAYDTAATLDKALRLTPNDLTPAALNRAFSLLGQLDSPRGIWAFNIKRTPQQKWFMRKLRLDGQVPANLLDTDLTVLS
jgi:branched-chain amino acid transport system substrate-binding protein